MNLAHKLPETAWTWINDKWQNHLTNNVSEEVDVLLDITSISQRWDNEFGTNLISFVFNHFEKVDIIFLLFNQIKNSEEKVKKFLDTIFPKNDKIISTHIYLSELQALFINEALMRNIPFNSISCEALSILKDNNPNVYLKVTKLIAFHLSNTLLLKRNDDLEKYFIDFWCLKEETYERFIPVIEDLKKEVCENYEEFDPEI